MPRHWLLHLVDQHIVPRGGGFGRNSLEHTFEQAVHQARNNNAAHKVSQRLQPFSQRVALKHRVNQEIHAPNFGQKHVPTSIQQISLGHER